MQVRKSIRLPENLHYNDGKKYSTTVSAKFQIKTRRDKQVYLNKKCKEIQNKKVNGKDRRFKKTKGIKRNFYTTLDTIKIKI